MPRTATDAADRLEAAALELFEVKGFRATTVPEIAARAGLTTRSFFRHYADKREVLFRGDDEIPDRVASLIASRPPGLSLGDLILWGVQTVGRQYTEPHRDLLLRRRSIVRSDPGLIERELLKRELLVETLVAALIAQGSDRLTATAAARLTGTVSSVAVDLWLDDPTARPLSEYVAEVHRALVDALTSREPFAPAPR